MKQLLKTIIPKSALVAYRNFREQRRVAQRRARRDRAETFSQPSFAALLRDLGIRAGDCVMVHSALGQFNNVEGGAQGVFDAITQVIGGQGTLIVPTFPNWARTLHTQAVFDVVHTPSETGFFTELVRKHPKAIRSIHPTHAMAAIGPLAQELTANHDTSAYAFGVDSPFFKHAKADGKILLIGVNLNSLTSFHVYEDLIAPSPWFAVYETAFRHFGLIGSDSVRRDYAGYFHAIDMVRKRDVERMREAFMQTAQLRTHVTDYSQISLLDAKAMVRTCLTQLAEGHSAYGAVTVPPEAQRSIDAAIKLLD